MKIKTVFYTLMITLAISSCGNKKNSYDELASSGRTTRTENLKSNLIKFNSKGVMIGQMYGTLEGIGWKNEKSKSDFFNICHDNPAVNGYELSGIESNKKTNIDGLQFSWIAKNAISAFKQGSMIVMNWTAPNYNGNKSILKAYVKSLSNFINNLQDGYGIKVPIVLYLYPVDGKSWYCNLSIDKYKKLYEDTKDMLNDNKVTNVILGYSETYKNNDFLERYPEDAEIINITYLQTKDNINITEYKNTLTSFLPKAISFAQEHNNTLGLTTGIESIPDSSYFSNILMPIVESHRLAYVMFGANHGDYKSGHFYTPYPGEGNDKIRGFMKLYNNEHTIFLSKLNGLYLESK